MLPPSSVFSRSHHTMPRYTGQEGKKATFAEDAETGEPRTASLALSESFATAQRVIGPEPKLVGASLGLALAPLEPALVRLTR